jgi:hypothetical protein
MTVRHGQNRLSIARDICRTAEYCGAGKPTVPIDRDREAERRCRIDNLVEKHRQEAKAVKERIERALKRARKTVRQAKAVLNEMKPKKRA